jgi:DNA-directed RNA polymerase specialized sigma subunit
MAARRMLLRSNHGLVAKIVSGFIAVQRSKGLNHLSYEDNLEAGMQGMLKAIIKFNPEVSTGSLRAGDRRGC